MWTEENPSFAGKHYRIDGAVCQPKPIQKPRPPIWIGGGGERFTLRTVAIHADGCNFIGLSTDEYRHKLDVLTNHCDTIERKIGDIRKSWQGSIIVGRDDSEIKARMQHAHAGNVGKEDLESHAIVGTPDHCTQRIGEYMDLGVDRFMLSFPEAATDINGIRLFADQVMPSFQ
jgi:alkanesulfonate monooxygenase SsuD/methylene tetrahydromethanopterin reductase-like flavin-dependent oxidoreductase (luciferase family)